MVKTLEKENKDKEKEKQVFWGLNPRITMRENEYWETYNHREKEQVEQKCERERKCEQKHETKNES